MTAGTGAGTAATGTAAAGAAGATPPPPSPAPVTRLHRLRRRSRKALSAGHGAGAAVAIAIVAALIISVVLVNHSNPPAKVHAKTVAQQGQEVIDAQKQAPSLQTAGQFCLAGIKENSKDTTVSEALDKIDPNGGAGKAWNFGNLAGDQVTVTKELASKQTFIGTFDLGQIIYVILHQAGEQATKGTQDELQWKLFSLIGPAAIYCAEAAFWLDGTVGGQIGAALQKKFLTLPIGQQLLASRGSAIVGKWVLYRKLKSCSVAGSNGCQLNQMDVTIACTGTGCMIIRTNGASPVFKPWDHPIPIAFSQGAWQARGTEKWAAQCDKAAVPGTGVVLALKVTSGKVLDGVWRAQGLQGSYTVSNVATSCFPAGTTLEEVSTTPFTQ